MLRHALVLTVVALGVARDPGCGGIDSSSSGPNAPCTRDKDCKDGLACERGVCTGPAEDAGGDAGASNDSGAADAAEGG